MAGSSVNDKFFLGEANGKAVTIGYRFLSRHGLIAGSTGTGKSRAMQLAAEQLSDDSIDVFVSDVKGDASGFCVEGEPSERNHLAPYQPHSLKANYWSVSDRFACFRFSASEIGPVLFSRMLTLNPTQESHLAIAFSYAKKFGKPLDTTDQLQEILDELIMTNQRGISQASISVVQRKIIALDESGLGKMFGKPSVRLADLHALNVLNLSDARRDMSVAMAPAFLLQKLFNELPEVGDVARPRIVVFFDEAHYLFKDANKSLRDLMVTMLKQIRSKGVSVFFITQDVTDLPDEVLSQLSTKIIFSQKVFTEKGASRLRALAKSFPTSDINIEETLKTMPPGVALLSSLDESGNQTAPIKVSIFAPASTMKVVPDSILRKSTDAALIKKYAAATEKPQAKPIMIKPQEKKRESDEPPVPLKKKQAGKSSQGSLLDGILSGLLKILDFILKALGIILSAIFTKPLRSFFKYLTKKPIRIIYLLVLLLIIYIIAVNWGVIASLLKALKFT